MKNLTLIFFLLWQTSKAQPIYFNLGGTSTAYVNSGVQSVATSGGTTTLNRLSVYLTTFTGTQAHTIVLPDATTLVVGNMYKVENASTGLITVQTSGGATIWAIAPGANVELTCSDIGTAAGVWQKSYRVGSVVSGKFMQFNNSLILSGTDNSTLNIGAGGTLGSNAYTSTAFAPLASPAFTGTPTGTSLAVTGVITSSGGGIGYVTGNGGIVTQATNKSTGVTLNKLAGDITMNSAALAAATIVSFTLTNSTIAATDIIHVQHQTTGTFGAYTINGRTAAGSAVISIRNNTAGSLGEAIVIKFTVLKSTIN